METSPLTQQNRPSSFQPKIDSLYEQLFDTYEDAEPDFDDRFWREFFLLRPDKTNLRRRLENIGGDDLLQIQDVDQGLFREQHNSSFDRQWHRSIPEMECPKSPPSMYVDDLVSGFHLVRLTAQTLTVFLSVILSRRYTNPSSEIITLLAGLDEVDACFLDFVDAIENAIRSANYNKFEFRNPYRLMFEDFVNDAATQKIILGLGSVCSRSRHHYVALQEDVGEGWTLSNTLKYIGLGVLAPSRSSTPTRNAPSADDSKDLFSTLPETDACILLSAYDFVNANKLFAHTFISHVDTSKLESPFSAFLSLTSYILHHAYRSPRATLYGHLNLITLRILVEDQSLCTRLFSPDLSTSVRICRQRPPFLPTTSAPRPLAATLFDIAIDTITHNLRRRLSVPLYIATLHLLHRLLSYLFTTRTRFPYHWPLLWQTLLSLLRFMTTYADSIRYDPDLPSLIDTFLTVLSLAVCSGDVFLPDTDCYDDLFYKIVENGHLLLRFKSAFYSIFHASTATLAASTTLNHTTAASATALTDALIGISDHFTSLLDEERGKGSTFGTGTKHLSPKEVSRVIRKGYESLRMPETEGLERWVRWREVDKKGMVKKFGRQAVEDARRVLAQLDTPIYLSMSLSRTLKNPLYTKLMGHWTEIDRTYVEWLDWMDSIELRNSALYMKPEQ
ncbi:MAG: hypothetical protein Q9171_000757 [Xanthocarpia ochracea]